MRNQVFSIAVCDDVQTEMEKSVEMTDEICKNEHICTAISCFDSAQKLLSEIKEGKRYDMLLLDVMMPGLDGMELARALRRQKENATIVFISSNREMALQGYEVSAVRYLSKPLDGGKLKEAIMFCYEQYRKDRVLLVPVNGSMRKVEPKDIYYIEIIGRKSRIKMANEELDTGLSLTELENMLSGQDFIRCHQSFLVNCRYIRSFRTSSMELTDGSNLPVSKHRIKEVRKAFFDYMGS